MVIVTAASATGPDCRVARTLDEDESPCVSRNEPSGYAGFGFETRAVRVTHYSMRSHNGPSYLTLWATKGPGGGRTWEEIDQRKNNGDLNGKWH